MHNVMYSLYVVFIFEFIWACHCDLAKYVEPRVDGNSPVKIGLSPTIMKVFIKGNLLTDEIEKMVELYSRGGKTQNEVEGGSNPMMDYLEKIYSFRNYDLLRPYRSIFRGLKALGKHDHTTHSSWFKFLNRGKLATDDYWELNEPIVTKMPYHPLRETSTIERLNTEMKGGTTGTTPAAIASSGTNGTNSSSPTPKKHSHLKSPLDVVGRKELSTPPSLRFCGQPCDVLEQGEATKLAPSLSPVSEPEEEKITISSGNGCDEDDDDIEVLSQGGADDVLNIPFNKNLNPFASKTTIHTSTPAHPDQIGTHQTKPPKHVFTGTANPNVWTLPPHPILDKGDSIDVISTRLGGGGVDVPPQTSSPSSVFAPSPALCSLTSSTSSNFECTRPEFCMTRPRKPQKIIVRISSSLGEVPVVIMRDNRTNGVSLSLVSDFILDEKNKLFKKVKQKNMLAHNSKLNFNQSKFLPDIRIYPKNRSQLLPHPVLHPPRFMPRPLFAPPLRPFPFRLNPLARVYGLPEQRAGPQAYPQPFKLSLRPPLFPLYFGGNLQAPIPPPRQSLK